MRDLCKDDVLQVVTLSSAYLVNRMEVFVIAACSGEEASARAAIHD